MDKQKQTLYEEVMTASRTEEKLKAAQCDIERHLAEMQAMAEKNT